MNKTKDLETLAEIIDGCHNWYTNMLRVISFVDQHSVDDIPSRNSEMIAWFENAAERHVIIPTTCETLIAQYHDLHVYSERLVHQVFEEKVAMNAHDFDKLAELFTAFAGNLRAVQTELVHDSLGMDALTGLKSAERLVEDFGKEMERLSRKGLPFCLAIVRVDQYAGICKELSLKDQQYYLEQTAALIKKSIRSFDDGYEIGNGEFILALKQADKSGGVAALERLKSFLVDRELKVTLEGKERLLSMSCCIAEPFPGDELDFLLGCLRDDLQEVKESESAVLEYIELSPLERYVKTEGA